MPNQDNLHRLCESIISELQVCVRYCQRQDDIEFNTLKCIGKITEDAIEEVNMLHVDSIEEAGQLKSLYDRLTALHSLTSMLANSVSRLEESAASAITDVKKMMASVDDPVDDEL